MKIVPCFALTLALAGCSTPSPTPPASSSSSAKAPASTTGLPFGDMRVVSPARLDQAPTLAFMPSPFELSAELAKRKVTGEATIAFTVSAQGKPEQIRIVQSTDLQLGQLATAYVGRLVFRSARLGGMSVPCEMEIPFSRK